MLILLIKLINQDDFGHIKSGLLIGLVLVIIIIYSGCFGCLLCGMMCQYIDMVGRGVTLNEKIKFGEKVETTAEKLQREQTKDDQMCSHNYRKFFCEPLPPSQLLFK